MRTSVPKPRWPLYFGVNVVFLLGMSLAQAAGGSPNPRLFYVVALFGLCSSSAIDLDGLNGRYSLLAMFLAAYFVFFGVVDAMNIVTGTAVSGADSVLSPAECVILLGAGLLIASYRVTVAVGGAARRRGPPQDWPVPMLLLVGLGLWLIGTYATYLWNVNIIKDTTTEATHAGLAGLSQIATTAFILAQLVQPLGLLLLVYAWRLTRSWYLWILVMVMVCLQVVLGFIIDIKGVAMIGGLLVIVTCILMDGRIPKGWVVAGIVFILFGFPIFQAYRTEVHGNRGASRADVVENLGKYVALAISAEDRVNSGHDRSQTFFERASLKGSVEMIVNMTGNGVAYQNGYTLTPIVSAFIPRIIWSDKPDVPTGQIVNKEFHVSDVAATYISPSNIGELYWNFGFPGVVIGMSMIGGICGFVARFNLAESRTVTRLLVTVLTIKYVINGFESSIAAEYVLWLRSIAAVGLLHLLFARSRSDVPAVQLRPADAAAEPTTRSMTFPNLIR